MPLLTQNQHSTTYMCDNWNSKLTLYANKQSSIEINSIKSRDTPMVKSWMLGHPGSPPDAFYMFANISFLADVINAQHQ